MNRLIEVLRELAAPSPYRYAVRVAGLALAYFLAARVGLEYAVINPVISTIWPASGIALAAVLLGGLRLLPAIFIGAFAVNYLIHGNMTVSAITGLGNLLEVLLGILLLRRVFDFDVRVSRLRDVVCLIVVAATLAPLPAALLGPLSLALFGSLTWPEFVRAFPAWWMGDSLGIVVVAPLILTWAARPALDWGSPRFWYVTMLLAFQFAVCYAVFGGFLLNDLGLSRVTYFVLPFAVWIALAHDIRFTALANAGLFAIAVSGTAHGTGPFAGVSVETDLVLLHIFLVVYSITTLLVAAVNGERNRAVADADNTADRFRSLSELSSDWYWEQDQNLRFTSISGSTKDRAGLSGTQSVGKTRFELPNEFESEEVRRRHEADLNAKRPFRDLALKRFRPDGEVHYALISGRPIFDSQGAFRGYRGVGREIGASGERRTPAASVPGHVHRLHHPRQILPDHRLEPRRGDDLRLYPRRGKRTLALRPDDSRARTPRRDGPHPDPAARRALLRRRQRKHYQERRHDHLQVAQHGAVECRWRAQWIHGDGGGRDRHDPGATRHPRKRGAFPRIDGDVLGLVLGTGRGIALFFPV